LDYLYERALRDLVKRAFSRMGLRLAEAAPTLSLHANDWIRSLAGTASAETYFMHERAFPMLLLPWWLEAHVHGTHDRGFHGDVVYSTLNGYYFVRMIDDLMDREHPPAPQVLPALIFFHTEFQGSYRRHFPNGHPFWDAYETASFMSAEAASKDADLLEIDGAQFKQISARKIAGVKVPIAAVSHRHDRADLLGPWSDFVDLLGCWHQMLNDMLDWNRDLEQGRITYFLSEASRQNAMPSVAEWVVSDGLPWGFAQLEEWMAQLLAAARDLDCPPLLAYLEERGRAVARVGQDLAPSLLAVSRLAQALTSTEDMTPGAAREGVSGHAGAARHARDL
jgi:hypothetical protein